MSPPLVFYLGMLFGCFLGVLAVGMLFVARRDEDRSDSAAAGRSRTAADE